MFGLVKGGRGRKVRTTVDEFGYFNDQDKLHHQIITKV
ncbi:hypothetical protein CCY16_00434 [Wolbachia endosymbiont of Wuchereria bancrofti]|nr:hypothetical protein CCY16_00434 [Wolbachia endosymbiont of Wuchereria bancrofti]